ncbi:MAG TPA: sugar ABC transporter permease, partial [Bacilli bacterium]
MKRDTFFYELTKNKVLYFMLMPAVVFFFVLSYLPMAGMVVAFKQFRYDKGLFFSDWIGLKNFEFFFISGKAWLITKNTVLYNMAFIITAVILQILVAIIISELGGSFAKKVIQTTLLLPFFISWVIVGTMAYNLFNYEFGSIN